MIANPNDGNSPRVEVATPMIDVSAGGLITAKTEQEKGYVPGGTKSATQQLTTQGAATITPGTTAQTAVASGRYTTGDVVVAGDVNLIPENIAEGVSIFGVDGTHSGGGFETCAGTFTGGGRFPLHGYYIDGNGELQAFDTSSSGGTVQATVAKNSIVIAENNDGTYHNKSGEIQDVDIFNSAFYVTGDFSIAG